MIDSAVKLSPAWVWTCPICGMEHVENRPWREVVCAHCEKGFPVEWPEPKGDQT